MLSLNKSKPKWIPSSRLLLSVSARPNLGSITQTDIKSRLKILGRSLINFHTTLKIPWFLCHPNDCVVWKIASSNQRSANLGFKTWLTRQSRAWDSNECALPSIAWMVWFLSPFWSWLEGRKRWFNSHTPNFSSPNEEEEEALNDFLSPIFKNRGQPNYWYSSLKPSLTRSKRYAKKIVKPSTGSIGFWSKQIAAYLQVESLFTRHFCAKCPEEGASQNDDDRNARPSLKCHGSEL